MEQTSIKKRVIGVDIGNMLTTYAIVDIRGNVIAHDSFPTSDYPDVNKYIDKLTEAIIEISEANGGYDTIRSVGISCPGGVSQAGHWILDPTYESFENHVFRNMRGKVRMILSELDDHERDVLGASALAWEVPEYSLFK